MELLLQLPAVVTSHCRARTTVARARTRLLDCATTMASHESIMTHVPEVANMARACIRTIAALDHELLDHAGEEAEEGIPPGNGGSERAKATEAPELPISEAQRASSEVADLFSRLGQLDAIVEAVRGARNKRSAQPLAKQRHKLCVELLPLMDKVEHLQAARARRLEERVQRLRWRKADVERAAKATGAQLPPQPRRAAGEQPDLATRNALRADLRQVLDAFGLVFSVGDRAGQPSQAHPQGGGGQIFGPELSQQLTELSAIHAEDSNILTSMAIGGSVHCQMDQSPPPKSRASQLWSIARARGTSLDKIEEDRRMAQDILEMARRSAKRRGLEKAVCEMLDKGGHLCHELLRVGYALLSFEDDRLAGSLPAATALAAAAAAGAAAAAAQPATPGKPQAMVMGAEEQRQLVQLLASDATTAADGSATPVSQTVQGASMVCELIIIRRPQIVQLLATEKLSRQLVKAVRRAHKAHDRFQFQIYTWQHRQEEVSELGELSSDEEEEGAGGDSADEGGEEDDFGDYQVLSLEELEAKLQALETQCATKIAAAEEAQALLQTELLPLLPELSFEPRVTAQPSWTPRRGSTHPQSMSFLPHAACTLFALCC